MTDDTTDATVTVLPFKAAGARTVTAEAEGIIESLTHLIAEIRKGGINPNGVLICFLEPGADPEGADDTMFFCHQGMNSLEAAGLALKLSQTLVQ